jgi:hypothetical protein
MQVSLTRKSAVYSKKFLLGFLAGCSARFLLFGLPMLAFGIWRWRDATWDLYLAFAGLFLALWVAALIWKWIEFKARHKSEVWIAGDDSDHFGAGWRASRRVL